MSQHKATMEKAKKQRKTTAEELAEMRTMIANLEPGKVVTLDRELQERNTTLMLMLYGAVAKYGIGMQEGGVMVTAQVPVLQVPANHLLQWEVSEDGKNVMLYIVLNETKLAEESTTNASVDVGDTATGEKRIHPTKETSSPSPASIASRKDEVLITEEGMASHEISDLIGDEFEDEIEVGLGD